MMRRRQALVMLAGALATAGCATPKPVLDVPAAPAAIEVPEPMETLATVRILRHVAMYYRLDLKNDNAEAQAMAAVMVAHESAVRDCYTTRLDSDPRLHGQLELDFQLSRSSGAMERIARAGGDLDDEPLFDCISRELAALPFNPPRDMRGTLEYTFDAHATVEP